MAAISSLGIGSGLDLNGLVKKLVDAEKAPLLALDKKEADYQAKLSAYGTLKSAFAAFQSSASSLSSASKFNTAKARAADASILTATASSIARTGSHTLEVTTLAQNHKIASEAFPDSVSAVGTGTLTISFGTYDGLTFAPNADKTSTDITIDATNNSLAGIRDAINEGDAGVTASIINDGVGYRLVVSSDDSGKDNSIRIIVTNDADADDTDTSGLSRLAYNPTAAVGSGKNLEEKMGALDAEFEIDGISIVKDSNVIDDAITGVTLKLLKTNGGSPTTLTIDRDTAGAKAAVEGLVKAYNELAATMKNLGGYNAKTETGGLLLGDATLRSMQNQIRNLLSQRLSSATGNITALSDIGVSFQRDGTLKLDSIKLDGVLADPSENLANLFAVFGTPTDSLVTYASSASATQAGTYALNVTQAGTAGVVTGSVALNDDVTKTTIAEDANDKLSVMLNDVTATVTLSAGSYTREELIAEIQSKINDNSLLKTLGHKVSVSQSAGIVTMTSTLYGSTSTVDVLATSNSAATTIFGWAFSTRDVNSVAGVDVAGEIGSSSGTGSGQYLTGTGGASGLKLLIEGNTTGSRGTVNFSRGIAWQIDQALAAMLDEDGTLATRTDGIAQSVEDIETQRTALEKRLSNIEARYRKQFAALDQLVASMQQTSNYLSQQLANLPKISSND